MPLEKQNKNKMNSISTLVHLNLDHVYKFQNNFFS